jgi:hypothetical protein
VVRSFIRWLLVAAGLEDRVGRWADDPSKGSSSHNERSRHGQPDHTSGRRVLGAISQGLSLLRTAQQAKYKWSPLDRHQVGLKYR